MDLFGVLYIPNFLPIILSVLLAFYFYGRRNFGFFHGLGIRGPKPTVFLGNLSEMSKYGFSHVFLKWHKEFGENVAMFWGSYPNISISDPEIIGQITVKYFSNFANRRFPYELDNYTNKMVSFARDEHWKYLRTVLTPSYSSKKMREMVPMIHEVMKILEKNLSKIVDSKKETDVNKLFSAYAMDIIASTGFGIQTDSLENPNSPVVKNAQEFFAENMFQCLQFIATIFPFTAKIAYLFNKTVLLLSAPYFAEYCRHLFKERKKEGNTNHRKDLLQLMLDSQIEGNEDLDEETEQKLNLENITDRRTKRGLTDDEVIAQCMIFLVGAYDTTANTIAYFTHTMALYPDIQQKLYEEIMETIGEESPDYDNVQKLTYLDMCFHEILRLYPVSLTLTRETKNDCTINGLKIPGGCGIIVSTMNMHHNPKYWPDPEKYDPERFNQENKAKIKPYTYIPFGDGPRICPGKRLATLEFKMTIVDMLRKFRFVPGEKTKKIEFGSSILLKPKHGVWVKVEYRD